MAPNWLDTVYERRVGREGENLIFRKKRREDIRGGINQTKEQITDKMAQHNNESLIGKRETQLDEDYIKMLGQFSHCGLFVVNYFMS